MSTAAPYPTVGTLPAKFGIRFNKPLIRYPYSNALYLTSKFKSSLGFKSSLKCHCIKKEITDKPTEVFSVLSSDISWERGSIWSTMALYMFNLHIPLGIGGLSIVTNVLHQPVLDPQTEVSEFPNLYFAQLNIVIHAGLDRVRKAKSSSMSKAIAC